MPHHFYRSTGNTGKAHQEVHPTDGVQASTTTVRLKSTVVNGASPVTVTTADRQRKPNMWVVCGTQARTWHKARKRASQCLPLAGLWCPGPNDLQQVVEALVNLISAKPWAKSPNRSRPGHKQNSTHAYLCIENSIHPELKKTPKSA